MWNHILELIRSDRQEKDYEYYKKRLEHVVKVLNKALESENKSEVIIFGRLFEKAFSKKGRE